MQKPAWKKKSEFSDFTSKITWVLFCFRGDWAHASIHITQRNQDRVSKNPLANYPELFDTKALSTQCILKIWNSLFRLVDDVQYRLLLYHPLRMQC